MSAMRPDYETPTCVSCGRTRPREEFPRRSKTDRRARSRCLDCVNAQRRAAYDPAERLAYFRARHPKHSERGIWVNIISRCTKPTDAAWPNYGARGIGVAPEWMGPDGFRRFLAHIGKRPTMRHTVDRINTLGNYEPGNVRWATATQQARNMRTNRLVDFRGERLPVAEWSERTGLHVNTISHRLDRGLPPAVALTLGTKACVGRLPCDIRKSVRMRFNLALSA